MAENGRGGEKKRENKRCWRERERKISRALGLNRRSHGGGRSFQEEVSHTDKLSPAGKLQVLSAAKL